MKKFIILFLAFFVGSKGLFAQAPKEKADMTQHTVYNCPMHPDVVSNKPGKCPKCGMNLVLSNKTEVKMYTCSMHPEIVSSQPGKCPKCGMTLVERKGGKNMDSSMHKMPM